MRNLPEGLSQREHQHFVAALGVNEDITIGVLLELYSCDLEVSVADIKFNLWRGGFTTSGLTFVLFELVAAGAVVWDNDSVKLTKRGREIAASLGNLAVT